MTRFSLSSLRVRSVLIVLLATIPALGLILWNAAEQRRTAMLEAEASALRLAQIAANNQERVIEVAGGFLSAVAQFPQAASANKSVFLHTDGTAKTVRERRV